MRLMALIQRIFRQLLRDKRTLGLLFIAPLFVLTLMNLVFNGNEVTPTVGVLQVSDEILEQMKDADIVVKEYSDATDVENLIREQELDGFLQKIDGSHTLTLANQDPSQAKSVQMKIKQILSVQQQELLLNQIGVTPSIPTTDPMKVQYVFGDEDTGVFDVFSPILIGFFVFFFVFLISGIGLLKERMTGTLERLLATPIRRWEIVTAYLVGFGVFAILQTFIIVLYAVHVLDIVLVGSIWNVMVINLILALVALSLGIFLSAFAASEFQMVQFIPIVIVPQIFFSGIFPLEGMAGWLQVVAKALPLYYAADALKGVMYMGEGLADIKGDLLILAAFAAVFVVLNILALKKYRTL